VLTLEVEKGRSWKHAPYRLELYDADGEYVGHIWSEAATLRKVKGELYFLCHSDGFLVSLLQVTVRVVAGGS